MHNNSQNKYKGGKMETKNLKVMAWVLSAVLVLSLITMIAVLSDKPDTITIKEVIKEQPIVIQNITYNAPEYTLTKDEFETQAIEKEALKLASESFNSRDFKKAVYDALVVYGEDIEDYKDIINFSIVDVDVEDDKVTYDVKVFYFIDGDKDEAFKARLDKFTISVDNLEFDDQFVDAEVDDSYMNTLSVKKVYEL